MLLLPLLTTALRILAWLLPLSAADYALCRLHHRCKPLASEYHTNTHPLRLALWSLPTTSTRWFQLHCACNWVIVAWTWAEWWALLWAPDPWVHVRTPTVNLEAMNLATALHVYHVLFWPLKPVDILHHVTSVFVCCPLMHYLDTVVMSWHLLIGTGLPGGIDYLFLTLVKYEVVPALVEKRVNAWLNAYVRAPLGVVGSFLTFAYLRQTPAVWKQWAAGVVMATTYWNATYFAKRAVESHAAYRVRVG